MGKMIRREERCNWLPLPWFLHHFPGTHRQEMFCTQKSHWKCQRMCCHVTALCRAWSTSVMGNRRGEQIRCGFCEMSRSRAAAERVMLKSTAPPVIPELGAGGFASVPPPRLPSHPPWFLRYTGKLSHVRGGVAERGGREPSVGGFSGTGSSCALQCAPLIPDGRSWSSVRPCQGPERTQACCRPPLWRGSKELGVTGGHHTCRSCIYNSPHSTEAVFQCTSSLRNKFSLFLVILKPSC